MEYDSPEYQEMMRLEREKRKNRIRPAIPPEDESENVIVLDPPDSPIPDLVPEPEPEPVDESIPVLPPIYTMKDPGGGST